MFKRILTSTCEERSENSSYILNYFPTMCVEPALNRVINWY